MTPAELATREQAAWKAAGMVDRIDARRTAPGTGKGNKPGVTRGRILRLWRLGVTSGVEIAAALDVSCAAVNRHVQKLRTEGLIK